MDGVLGERSERRGLEGVFVGGELGRLKGALMDGK
jgi:hypothetical protein